MKQWVLTLFSVLLLLSAKTSSAYEVETHEDISSEAALVSVLEKDNSLFTNIGLKQLSVISQEQRFPNSNGTQQTIDQLIRDGSRFEDNKPRALAHFYNPHTGQPIIGIGLPSPDWALEDTGQQSLLLFHDQEDSFADTRQFFLDALTKPTKDERDTQWSRTFQGLGQVIHHLQDMAQPQHVRGDAHLKVTDNGTLFIENPSLYEILTNRRDVRSTLPYTGYAPVYSAEDTETFNTARRFWDTDDGKGIAEYTNRGFVSAGTNFDKEPNPFPSPTLGLGREEDKTSLCNAINMPRPEGPSGQPLPCIMTFIETPVEDRYRPNPNAINRAASTFSIFHTDLMTYTQKPLFTLNRFNFDAAHTFLIPRAVGYSAGLINYFFRGEIDLVPDTNPANPGGYLLQNLGKEEISGTFTLYYDDVNNTRHAWREWTTSGPLPAQTGHFPVPAFAPPGAGDPAPKYPGQYILVFTGQMGQEPAAVTAKIVSAAALGLILTAGGDASGFARPGAGGAVTIETGVSLTPTAPTTTPLIVAAGETLTLDGGVYHFSEIAILGTLQLTADTILRADGLVGISGTIEGSDERDGIHLTIESGEVIALSGTVDVSGRSGPEMGSGDQPGGNGGSVTLRAASADVFSVPTIITRGGDAALTDARMVAKTFPGGAGGPITITTNSAPDQLVLRFVGSELPVDEVDPLPSQQGAHTLPTTTTFRRGLLTTGGYGGQFQGPVGELGVTVAGTAGGAGGSITIDCTQPSTIHLEQTDRSCPRIPGKRGE